MILGEAMVFQVCGFADWILAGDGSHSGCAMVGFLLSVGLWAGVGFL